MNQVPFEQKLTLNYIPETEFLIVFRDKLLQSQRDLALVLAELNAYTL